MLTKTSNISPETQFLRICPDIISLRIKSICDCQTLVIELARTEQQPMSKREIQETKYRTHKVNGISIYAHLSVQVDVRTNNCKRSQAVAT